jgi:hypothetical protein
MADPGTAVVVSGPEKRSEEILLLDHVRRIERSRQGTYVETMIAEENRKRELRRLKNRIERN